MNATGQKVLQDALTLPDRDRAEIATRLIESLESPDAGEDSIEEAWAIEIERRCEALDAGTTGTTPWTEVRRRIETEILRK